MNKVQLFLIVQSRGLCIEEQGETLIISDPEHNIDIDGTRMYTRWLFKVSYDFLVCMTPELLETMINSYQHARAKQERQVHNGK